MMNRIRQSFLTRTPREKFMVLIMLLVAAIIWMTFFSDRLEAFNTTRQEIGREIEFQRIYLDNRDAIRERVEAGIATLDTSETLSATDLFVEAGGIARRHGLSPRIDPASTEHGDIFSYHTLRMTVNRAEIADLINFTSDLQRRAPYIGIDEIVVTADRTDRRRLDARYRISAVELAR